jgi:hypothetical protein
MAATAFACVQIPKELQNPSFENDFQSWTVSGHQSIFIGDPNHPASDGSRVVVFNLDGAVPNAVLSQTIATTPGQRYSLAFDLGTVFAIADQRVRAIANGDGVLLDETIEAAGPNAKPFYIPQRLSFVANSPSTTITFEDHAYTYVVVDSFLDNVRVTPQNAEAPLITTHPHRTAVPVGKDATFSVAASGSGLNYQWQFNGADINGATGSSHTVAGVDAADAGNYAVVVSNGSGSVSSSAATLTVLPQAILLNGSFEYGSAAWTFSNSSVSTSTNPGYGMTDGTQIVHFGWGQQKPDGVLSQSFPTVVGQAYRLAFDVGAFSRVNTAEQRLRVSVVGGATLVSQTIAMSAPGNGSQYHAEAFTFVADSSTTTLRFEDQSSVTDSVDVVLDNVRVTLENAPRHPRARGNGAGDSTNTARRQPQGVTGSGRRTELRPANGS